MLALYRNPLTAYLHRAGLVQPGTVVHRLRRGPGLLVDSGPADIRVINEIWIDRTYANLPQMMPQDNWVIADVGANKGIYAAWILNRVRASLYCYEPDPWNYECLVHNVGARARTFKFAVGSREGVAILHQVPGGRALSSIVPGRLQARGTPTIPVEVRVVPLTTVVETCSSEIDLLKMDVEGAEYDILLNSPAEAFTRVRRIVVEYDAVSSVNPSVGGRELAGRLRHLGFEVDEGRVHGTGASIMAAWRRESRPRA
jgi:FkbM family methyltransferase